MDEPGIAGGPSNMTDSHEHDSKPGGDTSAPTTKKKMPKRPRKFSRTIEKSRSSKEPSLPSSAAAPASDPVDLSQSQAVPSGMTAVAAATACATEETAATARVTEETIRHHVSTKGSTRYVSNSVLKSNLKSSYEQLDLANVTVAKKEKQIQSLLKKNQELSDTVRHARQSTRQSKSLSLAEVNQTQSELKKMLSIIDEKDAELLKQKQLFDTRLSSAVAAAVEKEKARAARQVASLETKAMAKMEKCNKRHSIELADKDKELKRIKTICEGNTSVAIELRAEISKLRAQLDDSLSSNNIKLREKVNAVTKRSAEQVNSLKQTVAQKDRAITEVNDMALHVADEFNQLKNEKLADSRSHATQLEHHKKLAATRLQKLTELQQVTVDQQATIDEMRESHEEKESMFTTKIADLTLQLRKSGDKIGSLESELAEAIEEVH
eukprot:scaffold11020_cov66-Cyclotella_meneghiniana.AAC.1